MKRFLIAGAALVLAATAAPAADKTADKNLKVIEITFGNNSKFNWPFSEPSVKDLGNTVDMTRNNYGAKLIGKDVECVLAEDGSTFVINAQKYFLQNPKLGLRLGGVTTVKLPVVKGMSLVSVNLRHNTQTNFSRAFLAEGDGTSPVAGGEALKKSASEVKWSIADPKPGTQYSILMTNPKGSLDIKGMTLIYARKAVPTVYGLTTDKAKDGDGSFETLNGSFTALFAGADEFACGFDYKLAGAKKWTSVDCEIAAPKFSQKVTGLKADKDYVYKAWVCAPKSKKKVYGEEMAFSTAEAVVRIVFSEFESGKSKLPNARDAVKKNAGKIFTNNLGTDIDFKFWAEYGVALATSGGKPYALSLNPSKKLKEGGFDFGGQGNAWMKFPGSDGKKLSKIEIKFAGATPGRFNISSEVKDGAGNKDIAEPFKVTKNEKEFTFEPDGLEKGQGCYFCAEDATMALISEIIITYSFN